MRHSSRVNKKPPTAQRAHVPVEPSAAHETSTQTPAALNSPADALHWQGIIGNRTVTRMIVQTRQMACPSVPFAQREGELVAVPVAVNVPPSREIAYYQTLFRQAGNAEARRQLYKRLGLQLHPDKNRDLGSEPFQAMLAAYQLFVGPDGKPAEGSNELPGPPVPLPDLRESDILGQVFGGDSKALARFKALVGEAQLYDLYKAFGGRVGLPMLYKLFVEVCAGNVDELYQLISAIGGVRALRKMMVKFEANTTELAVYLAHYGSIASLAAAIIAHNFSPTRLEVTVANERKGQAALGAASVPSSEKVGHPLAGVIIDEWFTLLPQLIEMDAARHTDGVFLAGFISQLGGLLGRLDAIRKAIRKKIFGARRFSDSLKKLDEIHNEASGWQTRLGKKYEQTSGKMDFSQQKMIPSAADMPAIADKLKMMGATASHGKEALAGADSKDKLVTEALGSQGWALAGAEKKGAHQQAYFRIKALERLQGFNEQWGTNYQESDLDTILSHLAEQPLATNYYLASIKGANLGLSEAKGQKTLLEELMASVEFKNVWQTGVSQASANLGKRGAVEEQMGYSAALNRRGGVFQGITQSESKDFAVKRPEEMPKYAALVSSAQREGVAGRYGSSYVVWKDRVRERVTHTPGDSWNLADEQGAAFFTSNRHPEVLLANGNEHLLRLAAAEATGQDKEWLAKEQKRGADFGGPYFETQIHGNLTWDDVEEIVIGFGRYADNQGRVIEDTTVDDAKKMAEHLHNFAMDKKLTFRVRVRGDNSPGPQVTAKRVPVSGGPNPSGTQPGPARFPPSTRPSGSGPSGRVPAGNGYFLTAAQAAALASANLINLPIAPDGDCLFASLIAVGAFVGTVQQLRALVAGRVRRAEIDVQPFGLDQNETAREIGRSGSYNNLAGDATPSLIANALGCQIIIYNDDGTTTNLDGGPGGIFRVIRFLNPAPHYHATRPAPVGG